MAATQQTVRFVAACVGVQPTDAELSCSASTIGTTCQAIAQRSARKEQLLGGANVGTQAEVQQWLMLSGRELTPLMDDKLLQINAWLESRTFMAGSGLTLADLVVFGMTFPALTAFPAAQYNHFCNLLRWGDLIQARVGAQTVASTLSGGPLVVFKPLFVLPPPPAPPAAPAKADAGKAAPAAAAAAQGPAKAAAAAAPAPAADAKAAKKAGKDAPAAAAGATAAAAGKPDTAPAADKPAKKGDAAAGGSNKKEAKEGAGKKEGGGGKKEAAGGKKDEGAGVSDADIKVDILDIRVGQIVKVAKHPNADALYVEDIDVGEAQPRQVISGLVKFVPLEEMQNRRVLVVTNLKPAKMRDIMSYGMVLCASNDTHDKVVPVGVPEGVPLGERVTAQGYNAEPWAEINCKKKNYLEMLFPDLKTNADGVPCYKGSPFVTSGGPVTSPLPDAWVK